jgi:hypothetical protein
MPQKDLSASLFEGTQVNRGRVIDSSRSGESSKVTLRGTMPVVDAFGLLERDWRAVDDFKDQPVELLWFRTEIETNESYGYVKKWLRKKVKSFFCFVREKSPIRSKSTQSDEKMVKLSRICHWSKRTDESIGLAFRISMVHRVYVLTTLY